MTILDELAAEAHRRVAVSEKRLPLDELKTQVSALPRGTFAFERALKHPRAGSPLAFICECKKASPSKGIIAPTFPYVEIAQAYEAAGADAISVLTEPRWFLGKNEYLQEIAAQVTIPCLRKDFTVSPYMIYEARLLGAQAVLLICAILEDQELARYLALCDELGLSALVEAHNEAEIAMALRAGARVIGVNNRNLKDFSVDSSHSQRLRNLVPSEVLFVSESGVQNAQDVAKIAQAGADAVLIGEALMRAPNKSAMLAELRSGL